MHLRRTLRADNPVINILTANMLARSRRCVRTAGSVDETEDASIPSKRQASVPFGQAMSGPKMATVQKSFVSLLPDLSSICGV